ncbi:uncharacterized beta-barrel protein YwiB (DUF1934 family) [Melghirimyces profundicolus]|uniref:Uncharacterized beta-barrel protein YwiB (DUF1934 family) n=1 Tax=Melghirimyces profundicolus TaxID=1242148 RepID=A0A2T6C2J0_9BACL|nr:DUF1934 domain-containing protein [Melghirimyces profundicolus]PTX62457.1 uncharacterized beta-barrel protein YwiB (DUF1934 family) [Melghirimyces profundicolus]
MKRIQLSVESFIDPEDGGDQEEIKQQMEGRWEKRNHHWVLKYTENPGTPDEVKTTVKAGSDDVTVIRQGMVSYRQRYVPGKTTYCVVDTPGGTTEMEVRTLSYHRQFSDDSGRIQFSFRLFMGGDAMGRYQLTIEWTEVGEIT